jgi:hypothetical protein
MAALMWLLIVSSKAIVQKFYGANVEIYRRAVYAPVPAGSGQEPLSFATKPAGF